MVAGEVTELLRYVQKGDKSAEGKLLRLLYPELRRLARNQMRRERPEHTLQATALVHEAYLRLTLERERTWECRGQFLAIAARSMRQVLIDYARAHRRYKRGGGKILAALEDQVVGPPFKPTEVLQLDECLTRLARVDLRQSQIVEMRFFGGLGVEEVAVQLKISPKTVKREWSVARAWLYREMRRADGTRDRAMGES